MRKTILAALAVLTVLGCGRARPGEQPVPKTVPPANHFGQSPATQNTAPGLDAFGAGTGGSGTAKAKARLKATSKHGKGAGWFPTVSTNGTGLSNAADLDLVSQHSTEALAPSGNGLRVTGQGRAVELGGVSSQLGMSPDRPGVPNAAGISETP